MFISPLKESAVLPSGPDPVATPGSPRIESLSARALHARLLSNAAARRLRALEREAAERLEDAHYWKSACPVALAKAAALRETDAFPALP